jgi:hypothetical protein
MNLLPLPVAVALCIGTALSADPVWVPFNPPVPKPNSESFTDLRHLNERVAGEHGVIAMKDGRFVRSNDGQSIRFWAVNGPPSAITDSTGLRNVARTLARHGVNLVRIHTPVFDKKGDIDAERIGRLRETVSAMKQEGIYTLFSIYFPLWLDPPADTSWLKGYDGRSHAFASLFFNPDFQARYREWWTALLNSRDHSGLRLAEDPSVMGLEVQNEDSLFFWTFNEKNLPGPQLELFESQFAAWLVTRHGSLEKAIATWGSNPLPRDRPALRRMAFRPLWNIANERTPRDLDTARFLFETQARFYRESVAFLRSSGFRGVITASNWTTADPRVLGPLEKLSYLEGDFIDRHGYFAGAVKGENSEWSIREGHTYADRSALRMEGDRPGAPRSFNHPVMDPEYNGRASMISETTWNRPNRHRGEAPLFYAAYGALQDTDAIVHFALDGADWSVKPNYFMQPWTLMAPTQLGQFPATALLYRRGLVQSGDVLADIRLTRRELLDLKGTPLPQDAAFDELRLKDVPNGSTDVQPGQRLDPLIHFAGRTRVRLDADVSGTDLQPLQPWINHAAQTVRSTTGELLLDYRLGILEVRAPAAQGVSGNLAARGTVELPDLRIRSTLNPITILMVALDDQPLARSSRMLLQVMTEEQPTDWATEALPDGQKRITALGRDPWQFLAPEGTVECLRPDAASLRVSTLDLNGVRLQALGDARSIRLKSDTVYYLIER